MVTTRSTFADWHVRNGTADVTYCDNGNVFIRGMDRAGATDLFILADYTVVECFRGYVTLRPRRR